MRQQGADPDEFLACQRGACAPGHRFL